MSNLTRLLNDQQANPELKQAQIGRNNLLYGIFDNEWILLHNKTSTSYKGSHIVTKIIGAIFEAIITCWKTQNHQIHTTTPDSNEIRSRLPTHIDPTHIKALYDCLPNVLEQDCQLFNLSLQEQITKTTQTLKLFIHQNTPKSNDPSNYKNEQTGQQHWDIATYFI